MLKLIVDDINTVAEAHRGEYKKGEDGKFRLDLEGYEDPTNLKSALDKERTKARDEEKARKMAEARLKEFGDFSPETIKALQNRIENDEEAKMIAEGKLDDVIKRRTEKAIAAAQGETAKEKAAREASEKRAKAYEQRVLDDSIRAAATKAGIHAHAVDDALFRARTMFVLDENGIAVQLGSDGKPVIGKDGKTPFSPLEWLEGMKATAPHWFPNANAGGGGRGGEGDKGVKTMLRSQFDNIKDPAEKAKAAKEYKLVDD